MAVSGSFDDTVRLWNLETGACLATLQGHSGDVNTVQITADGRFAFSGSDDKTIKIWDLAAKICLGTLEGHDSRVDSIALSPDGGLIASAGFARQNRPSLGLEIRRVFAGDQLPKRCIAVCSLQS